MKHVYSGSELRGHAGPSGGQLPPAPPRPVPDPVGKSARGGLMLGIAVLSVLLAGLIAALVWALHGREAKPEPAPPSPSQRSFHAIHDSVVDDYLRTSGLSEQQQFEFVRSSPHVQGNRQYKDAMGKVQFQFDAGNDGVNAFADLEPGEDGGETPVIRCQAGAGRFARLVSLALAAELAGCEGSVQGLLQAMTPRQFAVLTAEDAGELLRKTGLEEMLADDNIRAEASAIGMGMLATVLAHESGHQALGHVFGRAENLEVSRNQEREADTFASSVVSTSGYSKYMFAGMLFWHYAFALQQGRATGESTHPLAEERLANLIQQNPGMAAAWGITVEE